MLYQISSGQGPAECELGVAKFLAYLQRRHQVTVEELSAGYHAETYRSVRLRSDEDLQAYVGSIQWICRSPYRPAHKRKNWFIDFSRLDEVATQSAFDPEQIVYERSAGCLPPQRSGGGMYGGTQSAPEQAKSSSPFAAALGAIWARATGRC